MKNNRFYSYLYPDCNKQICTKISTGFNHKRSAVFNGEPVICFLVINQSDLGDCMSSASLWQLGEKENIYSD